MECLCELYWCGFYVVIVVGVIKYGGKLICIKVLYSSGEVIFVEVGFGVIVDLVIG